MKIAAQVKEDLAETEEAKPLENAAIARLSRLNKAYKRKKYGWQTIAQDDIENDELEKCLKIDGYTAERVFQIMYMTEEERELCDTGQIDAYFRITGEILDRVLFELINQTELRLKATFLIGL